MNFRNYLWVGIGATLALALALVALLAPPASATNDPDSAGGAVYGDWTVTDTRSYDSVTIWLESGNLSVTAGGSLTMTNVRLRFNSSEDGNYSLTVAARGTLKLYDGTNVSSNFTNIHYRFIVSGTMDMNNASACEMWGDNSSWAGGIQIYSDTVTINNSRITRGRTGGVSIFDCSPTITNNTIRDNGQDGASAKYCFGMYVHNSRGVIDYNTVVNNIYKVTKSERTVVQLSKSGSGVFYKGEQYYGWYSYGYVNGVYTYYCYRYEYNYTYLYGDYDYYGVGIWMDNSNLNLNSNRIALNGWGMADGSYTYSYQYYQPLYTEYDGPYGTGYTYWYWLYLYAYNYNYIKVRCFGEGLHVESSTITLEKNTFERNGFQDRHDFYPNADTVGWYSGIDINLFDCTAQIYNNTVNSAATLLNLTRCTVTITGNKFLGDYIGAGGTYYSVNFIPSRVGYGIRYYQSKGDILNNTIEIKFKDYPVYIGGQNTYFADLVTAVDFPGAKDTNFIGNKVTVDSQYYGVCRGLLFNTSLKATNLKVLNCQFEFKYSGNVGVVKPTMPEFIIGLKSEAYVDNCTFKAPSAGGTYSPQVYGIMASFGTTLTVVNSTFSNHHRALMVTDFSTLTASGVTVTGVQEAGVYLESLSKATITGCKLSGGARGIMAIKSTADIYNCVLNNPLEFFIDKAASINVYNTPHVKDSVLAMDNASYLNVSWPITLNVMWQNGVPVEGARVVIATMNGMQVFTGTTNETGYPAEVIWVKEYVVHLMTSYKYNPHRITVSKGRASSLDMFIIDRALPIEFRLVDNVPPELSVAYPFDGQRLNASLVEFSGRASDPEAGLLDSAIEINIDNTGWVQVEVKPDDTWGFSRPLGDGLHVVRVKAGDLAGNVARESLSVFVDTTGPVLQVFSPTEGCFTNQRTVNVMGITEERVFVTVNGISVELQKRYFSKQISLDVGPNLITVVASDAAGNARQVQLHVTFDIQPPILEIRSPRNGDYTNQDPLSVLGSSEPSATIRVNGIRAQLVESSFEALVGMSEGANTVTVTAQDQAGNTATQVFTVYLDTAAPDLTIFTPRDGLWTNQSKVLVNGATEQGALVTINGQNTNVVSTIFSGYVALLEGANRIELVARDSAGNLLSVERTVFLDTRKPDLILTSPGDRLVLNTRVVQVVGSVDYGSEVRVDGELVQVTDFVFTTTVSYAEDGTHVLEVTARDPAGNTAMLTCTVTIDTTTPPVILSYPLDGMKVKQRLITVSGQTEPFATVIINTETMLVVGRDGLFQVPVVLEDGENRITVKTTDAAGNTRTESVTVTKPVTKAAPVEDLSWVLNLTGLLVGIGIALPIMTHAVTGSWRRRREGVLAELEAAESARKAKEAEEARLAALPRVEKMGKKRAKAAAEHPKEEKAPAVLPEAPKAEAAAPEVAKTGLKDKSGATEVSPDEIDQETKMKAKSEAPPEEKKPATGEAAESSLKDKGGESEGEAGDTEIQGNKKK